MPRSMDGRWTRQCQICGKDFQQQRPDVITCSFACRAKLPHNTGGRRVKSGLEPRTCAACGKEFQPIRGKQSYCSSSCYWRSPAGRQSRERANARRRNDPEVAARNREYGRAHQLRSRYGITVDEYDAKLAAQGGVCAICGRPPRPNGVRAASRLHVDHDHGTGRNRDLICNSCNQGVGYFGDDPVLMRAAAEYIERHRSEGND